MLNGFAFKKLYDVICMYNFTCPVKKVYDNQTEKPNIILHLIVLEKNIYFLCLEIQLKLTKMEATYLINVTYTRIMLQFSEMISQQNNILYMYLVCSCAMKHK